MILPVKAITGQCTKLDSNMYWPVCRLDSHSCLYMLPGSTPGCPLPSGIFQELLPAL